MKCQNKLQRKQRNVLAAKKDKAITKHLENGFTSIPRKLRTVKKNQKFKPSTSWIGYKKENRKKDSKNANQTCNNWYSKPFQNTRFQDPFPMI